MCGSTVGKVTGGWEIDLPFEGRFWHSDVGTINRFTV